MFKLLFITLNQVPPPPKCICCKFIKCKTQRKQQLPGHKNMKKQRGRERQREQGLGNGPELTNSNTICISLYLKSGGLKKLKLRFSDSSFSNGRIFCLSLSCLVCRVPLGFGILFGQIWRLHFGFCEVVILSFFHNFFWHFIHQMIIQIITCRLVSNENDG